MQPNLAFHYCGKKYQKKKKNTPPSIVTWLRIVEEIKKLEDLVLTAQNKQEKH